MTTTSATSSTSNAGAAAIAAMGAGSGMDVKALAQAIVDAQKTPQTDAINKKITQSNAKISGYSAVRYVLDQLKTAFLDINTTSDFNALALTNSQTSAFTATATTSASASNHTVQVNQLATSQRSASLASYAASNTPIDGLDSLTLNVGSKQYSALTFSPMTRGQSVTVNGLTFTAAGTMTAAQVGAAFGSLTSGMTSTAAAAANATSASLGTYSGAFTAGFTTGTATNGVVTASSTTPGSVTDIVVAAVAAPSAPQVTTTDGIIDGVADTAETATLTFNDLAAGQSVTANGLTFTATTAMTATQVGEAYASLTSGMTGAAAATANSASAALGVYSGTFTAGFTTGTASNGSVIATSTITGNVTDIAASAVSEPIAPTVVTSLGSATSTTISVSTATPEGVVESINKVSSTTGVSAQLVRVSSTGAYQIVVSGSSGADNAFTMTSNDTNGSLTIGSTSATGLLTSAQDASLTVDGLNIKRSTNHIDDVITGVTLDLNGATTGSANLNLALDTTPVATKISALVDAYNTVQSVLTDAYNKDSKTAEYGASLVGDSTVQSIRSEIRAMFFPSTGSTGSTITSLRDLGVSVDAKGVMTLDKAKLSTSLQTNFAGAVTMLTNNVNGSYISSTDSNGVANNAINKLTSLLSNDGLLVVQSNNAAKKVTDYQDQLTKLNDRMTALLDRYNKQFAAMETIVGQSKSLQTSLKSTFANMNSSSSN